MPSYSRKRPANKGEITSPVVRIQQDQVTGRITHVVLDDVQKGFEATLRAFEGWSIKLQPQQVARMAEKVIRAMLMKRRCTDSQLEAVEKFLDATRFPDEPSAGGEV